MKDLKIMVRWLMILVVVVFAANHIRLLSIGIMAILTGMAVGFAIVGIIWLFAWTFTGDE